MVEKRCVDSSFGKDAFRRRVREALLARRRRYNRLYMRRWRADPAHETRERAKRREWYYERKRREAGEILQPFTNYRGEPVCGFCCKNPPVTRIARLRICEGRRGGYVEVLVPYCGEC